MKQNRTRTYRSATITALLLFAAFGSAFAQGGGSGGTQGGGGSGSGGGIPGGTAPASPKSAPRKPASTGAGTSGGASTTTGRTNPVHMDETDAGVAAKAKSPEKEFDSWLATSKEGLRLGSVNDRLRQAAAPALVAGVPLEAFKARIREAVAKGALPDIVAAAMEADAARWIWLSTLVREGSWPPEKTAAGFYLAVASALRNGLGEAAVRDVVTWARTSRASTEKAGAALTVAASLSAALGTRGGQADSVARIMASSRLRIGQYDAVTELAYRAVAAGISAERYLALLESTVGQGRTLADFEKALFP